MRRRLRLACAGAVLLAAVAAPGAVAGAGPADAAVAPREPCQYTSGTRIDGVPWAQKRLNFQRIWSITRGERADGSRVRVAVVDTGLNKQNPQTAPIVTIPGVDLVNSGWGTADCSEHGTEVTSLIAAQRAGTSSLYGVAPDVAVMPIKQTKTENDSSGTAYTLADGILAAVRAKVDVINLSVYVKAQVPQLLHAVQVANSAGVVIVAAAGNEGQNGNPVTYPAAYSTSYANVIAVSATDKTDQFAPISESGPYVDVAAPGVDVQAVTPGTGNKIVTGTSFSAPYVTGTVALMLAAHPSLSPLQVRDRLEATADPPPQTVPSADYGYGIINPYLAVTAVGADLVPSAQPSAGAALAPIRIPAPASRHQQHVALAVSFGLLGLAAVVLVLAGVLRISRRRPGPTTSRPA